jgi:hypothetical protein
MSKKSRMKELLKAADKLTALNLSPLTDEELEAEIQTVQKERKANIIEDLFQNPIKVKDFKPLSREEAHSRKPKEK